MSASRRPGFALVSIVVTHGENMRFRLDAEPVIWLITALTAAGVSSFFWTRAGSSVHADRR